MPQLQPRALKKKSSGGDHRRAWEIVEQLLEAGAAAVRAREAVSASAGGDKPPLTLNSVYEDWLARRKKRRLRNTKTERSHLVNHVLPVIGDLPLDEIRVRQIRDLVERLRGSTLAPRTVRAIYGTLHKLFADLVVDEMLVTSPCVLTRDQLPKIRDKDPEWRAGALFMSSEVELLISADGIPWDRRVVNAIAFFTGARIGEVFGLRWRDLDEWARPLQRLLIARSYDQPTKTETPRCVPVHPVLRRVLTEWRARGWKEMIGREPGVDDLIVPSRRGRIRSRNQHRGKFLKDLKRLGLRHRRVHDSRRTLITLARVAGARRDVLEQITHAGSGDIMDLYTSLPWPTLCLAISCLRLRLLTTAQVYRRLTQLREGPSSDATVTVAAPE